MTCWFRYRSSIESDKKREQSFGFDNIKGTVTSTRAILRSPDGENMNGADVKENRKRRFADSMFGPIFQRILLQRTTERWV